MVPLTRILSLTAACALVVLTAATPARAGEFAQKQASVGSDKPSVTQCGMFKRAMSRRLVMLASSAECISTPPRTSDGLAPLTGLSAR